MRYEITYHHTTEEGFKIYLLKDTTKPSFNAGSHVIYANLEHCTELMKRLIREGEQLSLFGVDSK